MEREQQQCRDCGFDLGKLEMSVLYAGRGVDGARRRLFCPICRGGPIELSAERLAFPREESTWVRWREGGTPAVPNVLQVGRLKLRIEARVETLSADQICFRAVPTFISDGKKAFPALPVMPEYLDCLDPKALAQAQQYPERFGRVVQDGGKARYRSVIPLRGLRETEWPTVECEVMAAQSQSSVAADVDARAFRGVTLKLWPNLKRPFAEWKYYVASVGATSDEGLALVAPGRTFRSRMFVPAGVEGADHASFTEIPLDQELGVEGAPSTFVGASMAGRPAWISMEFRRTDGEPLGGGLFAVAPNSAEVTLAGEASLGIDFGTTNTVLAIRRPDGTIDCIAPERGESRAPTTLYLVNGGSAPLPGVMDLWPGGEWTGAHHDILPSELGSLRRWTDIGSRERIEALAFGRDFGVPVRGARANLPPEHVVGEFKWLRAVQKEKSALAHQDVLEALQARYLESAMMMAMAAVLAESPSAPRSVTVYYSYPLAFEDHDLRTLERATVAAEKRLKERTGLDFKFLELMDEAQAAVGTTGSHKMFRVCVDLGGGSLEVLVDDTWARHGKLGHEGFHPHVFSTSVFFGGSVYLRSLVGSGESERRSACVLPAMASYTRLASEVRRWESGRTLIESPDIIAEARKSTAVRRARVYIGYVVELVARVLAGVCLEHGRTREGALDLSRNRLFTLTTLGGTRRWVLGTPAEGGRRKIEFSLVLLGNGWGFADIVRDGKNSVEQMVAQRVRIRLMELLRAAAVTAHIGDGMLSLTQALDDEVDPALRLEVGCEPPSGSHRKARVARGLLEAQDQPQHAQGFDTRANGRHGVLGFDLLLADSGREIAWYRPFGPPARDRPELMAPPVEAPAGAVPSASARATAESATTQANPSALMVPPMPASAMPEPPAVRPSVGALGPPGFGPAGGIEAHVWMLSQQWAQVTAAAAQAGLTPFEFAGRQLWGQVMSAAQQRDITPEQLLANERWDQVRASLAPPGTPAEQLNALTQQRWSEVVAKATQRGASPSTILANERWEQLLAALARSVPASFGALPPAPPFPLEPNPTR